MAQKINQNLSEEDIKFRFIEEALSNSNWKKEQIRKEYAITDGSVVIKNKKAKRSKPLRADYLLSYKDNLPLAVVEAKKQEYSVSHGIQQAMNYAKKLDIPFCYSSNGDGFIEYDFLKGIQRNLKLEEFPTPEELWSRYTQKKAINSDQEKIITQAYSYKKGDNQPRYYQRIAINKTVEAVAKGQDRILLVMATGTGKTFTAYHIIDRLLNSGAKKKVLFLADRNILIDQTMAQDFKPFQKKTTKIGRKKLDSSYQIYMSLYHQLAGEYSEEPFRQFEPSFFDLIIIDECHRGSAKEESRWRAILDYFSSATQIGLTATPKADDNVNTFKYFGEPIYTYSLRQGIEDGFLAPYKVIRSLVNIDDNWRPEKGQKDEQGEEIEDREYNVSDYDKNIIIKDRTERVAKRITQWLKDNGEMSKTIVFCVGQNHADRLRQELANLNPEMMKKDHRYVMRITGDDDEGKNQLDYFIDVDEKYPVVATTSKLLTTGVDCKTVKLIVLDNNINSMTEFKQIVGRGTRLRTDKDKWFFTIMDFRGNSRHFADPKFDGDPLELIDDCPECETYPCQCPKKNCPECGNLPCTCSTLPKPIDNTCPNCGESPCSCQVQLCPICGQIPCICDPETPKTPIPVVKKGEVKVTIVQEQVQYLDPQGKLITERIIDYSKKKIKGQYKELSDFLSEWTDKERREKIINLLDNSGISLETLRAQANKSEDMDDFDLLCHIAYDKKPLTRKERAENVKKRDYLNKYEGLARQVIEQLIDLYADSGVDAIDDIRILQIKPFVQWGDRNIEKAFGGMNNFEAALHDLRATIYNVA